MALGVNVYELKEYLNAINFSKKNVMDSEDTMWVKKYPAFIVNKVLSGFSDTIMLVNEMNRNHFLDKDISFKKSKFAAIPAYMTMKKRILQLKCNLQDF